MNFILHYIILFLNFLENSRKLAYEKTAQWVEKREMVTNFLTSLESHFTKFHPFTLIIGFFFLFILLRYILRKIKKTWRRMSKKYLNTRLP